MGIFEPPPHVAPTLEPVAAGESLGVVNRELMTVHFDYLWADYYPTHRRALRIAEFTARLGPLPGVELELVPNLAARLGANRLPLPAGLDRLGELLLKIERYHHISISYLLRTEGYTLNAFLPQ